MHASIDELKKIRQKSFDETGKKETAEFGEYLRSLEEIIEYLRMTSKSESSNDWEKIINISSKIISYFNELSGIKNYNENSLWGKWFSRYDKWRKRKVILTDDGERYSILKIVINSTLIKIKREVVKDGKVIPSVYIVDDIELPKDIKKIFQEYIDEMLWEIRCSRIGNKLLVYNSLFECFVTWEETFLNNKSIVEYLHFRQLWATMKLKKYVGKTLLSEKTLFSRRTIESLINTTSWLIRLFFWIISGFGEKTLRFIFWVFSFIILFGILYSYFGWIKISYCGNMLDRFFDGLYFSVITITTLGYGDIYPYHDLGKIVTSVEVSLGYILLAVLTHLIIKKLKI